MHLLLGAVTSAEGALRAQLDFVGLTEQVVRDALDDPERLCDEPPVTPVLDVSAREALVESLWACLGDRRRSIRLDDLLLGALSAETEAVRHWSDRGIDVALLRRIVRGELDEFRLKVLSRLKAGDDVLRVAKAMNISPETARREVQLVAYALGIDLAELTGSATEPFRADRLGGHTATVVTPADKAMASNARWRDTVPMFERFTDRSRRILVLAQEEARRLNHNFIGTEHILLGLLAEGEGVAAKALTSLGISLEAVREKVEETIGPAGEFTPTGSPPFSPRAKKVLELSLREALQLGHNYIGTEHVLLGLVREGEGVGAQVLINLGADLTRVRQQVIQTLSGKAEINDPRRGIGGDNVEKADIPAPASSLFGWEDAAEVLRPRPLLADAKTDRSELDGIVYETCSYVPRPLPEVHVSVAGAVVSRQAFDAYTEDSVPDAEVVDGVGDAATYSASRHSLRVLSGATLLVVQVRRHEQPKDIAIAAARRVVAKLSRLATE